VSWRLSVGNTDKIGSIPIPDFVKQHCQGIVKGENMLVARYKSKKDLKASIGQTLKYCETSLFGYEYQSNGKFAVVGPSPTERKWYATVVMVDDKISKVT
jgi:hypothetical protein